MSAGAMVEMLLWLGVVVAFILVCAWAYRRLYGRHWMPYLLTAPFMTMERPAARPC